MASGRLQHMLRVEIDFDNNRKTYFNDVGFRKGAGWHVQELC
jgi:hypothetical protein